MNADGLLKKCHGNRLNLHTGRLCQKWVFSARRQDSRQWAVHGAKLRVVFVTTEVAPWSKVGGLGDVMAALPAALAARGHRVMTVSPMYSNYSDVRDTGVRAPVQMPLDTLEGDQQQQVCELAEDVCAPNAEDAAAGDTATANMGRLSTAQEAAARQAARVYARNEGPAVKDIARAAAVYDRAAAAARLPTLSPDSSSCTAAASANYVRYYMCCSSGVDRVFVDHPLYHGAGDRQGGRPWSAAIVSSYCHPDAPDSASRPDLAAAASVLCQAALAAPLLLWGATKGPGIPSLRAAAQQPQQHEQQQELEAALLARLLGLEESHAASYQPAVVHGRDPVTMLLSASTQQQAAQLSVALQHPQQIVAGRAQPVMLGTGGSKVDRRWPVCDLLLPRGQQPYAQGNSSGSSSSSGHGSEASREADADGPVVFVANDWPCGVLPVWLDMYKQEAQQQQQNPHLEWLRDQQRGVFSIHQHHVQKQHDVQEAAQAAMNACNSKGSSSTEASGRAANTPGLNMVQGVLEDYAVDLGSPALQAEQPLQQSQQDWKSVTDAGLGSARPEKSTSRSSRCNQILQPLPGDVQDYSNNLDGGSSGSAAAEALLNGAGYNPDSVYSAKLSQQVSDAIAQGRVPPAVLPALAAAQSQLQQLLLQEQALGDAIERLRSASGDIDQQEGRPGSSSSSTVKQESTNVRDPQQHQHRQLQQQSQDQNLTLLSSQAAMVLAGSSGHGQELASLQRLLGQQLANAKVAFAVHNNAYQGAFRGRQHFDRLGLPARLLPVFRAPASHAAQAVTKVGSTVMTAAASAVTAVGSQLAALSEALQRLGQPKMSVDYYSSGQSGQQSSSYGLLASIQQLLIQASAQTDLEQAASEAIQQQAGNDGSGVVSQSAVAAADSAWEQPQPPAVPTDTDFDVNWMAAGINLSDTVVTVSSGYAREMLKLQSPSCNNEGGATNHVHHLAPSGAAADAGNGSPSGSMEALLIAKQLRGIINGLDTTFWDPACDPLLPAAIRYSPNCVSHGKAAAKKLLQRRMGLSLDADAPLFAFIGRLVPQKGVDVILAALPQVMQAQHSAGAGVALQSSSISNKGPMQKQAMQVAAGSGSSQPQLVVLGAGEKWMEHVLSQLSYRYPGSAVGVPAFNEPLAHLIMAAADFLLVPSRYEPCGLVALAGLRYGALPIATATGGLGDIVTPEVGYRVVNPGPEGDTAGFRRGVAGLVAVMQRAVAEYGGPEFEAKRAAAMAVDVSWEKPCAEWEQVLLQLVTQDVTDANGSGPAAGSGAEGHCAVSNS